MAVQAICDVVASIVVRLRPRVAPCSQLTAILWRASARADAQTETTAPFTSVLRVEVTYHVALPLERGALHARACATRQGSCHCQPVERAPPCPRLTRAR